MIDRDCGIGERASARGPSDWERARTPRLAADAFGRKASTTGSLTHRSTNSSRARHDFLENHPNPHPAGSRIPRFEQRLGSATCAVVVVDDHWSTRNAATRRWA